MRNPAFWRRPKIGTPVNVAVVGVEPERKLSVCVVWVGNTDEKLPVLYETGELAILPVTVNELSLLRTLVEKAGTAAQPTLMFVTPVRS